MISTRFGSGRGLTRRHRSPRRPGLLLAAVGRTETERPEQPTRDTTLRGEHNLARGLARELRPYWLRMFGLLLLSMLATPPALLTPVPLKIVVDSLLGSQTPPPVLESIMPAGSDSALLIGASLLVVAVALLTQLQDLATTVCRTFTGERLLLDIRTRLFRHVQAAVRLLPRVAGHDGLDIPHPIRRSSRTSSGRAWSPPATIGPDSGADPRGPSLDPGRTHRSQDSNNQGLTHSRSARYTPRDRSAARPDCQGLGRVEAPAVPFARCREWLRQL